MCAHEYVNKGTQNLFNVFMNQILYNIDNK